MFDFGWSDFFPYYEATDELKKYFDLKGVPAALLRKVGVEVRADSVDDAATRFLGSLPNPWVMGFRSVSPKRHTARNAAPTRRIGAGAPADAGRRPSGAVVGSTDI